MVSHPLIAIPVCWVPDYRIPGMSLGYEPIPSVGRRDACRSWLRHASCDYKFFLGSESHAPVVNSNAVAPDEVVLDCPDGYAFLPHKLRAICRWALDRGYSHIFKCDDDTLVRPQMLLASDWAQHDYLGWWDEQALPQHRHCLGGPGYWLSRRAMLILLTHPIDSYADDAWVGKALRIAGLQSPPDARYHEDRVFTTPCPHDWISQHPRTPEQM